MNYQKLDKNNWKRWDLFWFFIHDMRVVINLTVDIDVAPLIAYVKKQGLEFYPSMMWVVSKVINAHEEFKLGWNEEGELVLWDVVSPAYSVFHEEDQSFAKLVTKHSEDIAQFRERYIADGERLKNARAMEAKRPPNYFDVSCLPWVKYKHFDMRIADNDRFLAPILAWGKYEKENDKALMPLTMIINHAVADGFHVARFFNEVQALINTLN